MEAASSAPEGVIEVNDPASIEIFDKIAGWVGDIVPPDVLNYEEEAPVPSGRRGTRRLHAQLGYAYPRARPRTAPSAISSGLVFGARQGSWHERRNAGWLGIGVSRYSQNIEAASAFAIWVTSYDQLVDFHPARGEQPAMPALYQDAQLLEALPYLA